MPNEIELEGLHPAVSARIEHGGMPLDVMQRAALRFESKLYFELEAWGHRIEADRIVVDGESFFLAIEEPWEQVSIRWQAEPRAPRGSRPDSAPPGRLVLIVNHLDKETSTRRWTYRPGRVLAPQVKTLVKRFEALVVHIHHARARERAYQRSLRRMAARYRWDLAAAERPKRLRSMTENWHEAKRMHAFIEALNLHLLDHPSEALAKWVDWARQHADDLDPFSALNLHDLEAHAAILAKPKRGKMESDEEELRWLGALDEYL